MNLGVRGTLKPFQNQNLDAIVAMSCGDGVQVVAANINVPVYPSNNTMFLGEAVKFGLFKEACHLCGNCVLGTTGGICPISRCAKSLVNGTLRRRQERQVRSESGERTAPGSSSTTASKSWVSWTSWPRPVPTRATAT